MAKSWYIIHTYSGYEQKIERTIRSMLEEGELDSSIVTNVKVPMEEVEEVSEKTKKKSIRHNKLLPSYIMLEMDLPQLGWRAVCNAVRHIQGVTGFVGTNPNERPRPISNEEAKALFQQSGDIKGEKVVRVKHSYEVGDHVRIKGGPFSSFEGVIESVSPDKDKLSVNVEIFGRPTPVEIGVLEVEKV